MTEACEHVIAWNQHIHSGDDYLKSPDGMQQLAASCMLIESIGEGAKKIEKLHPTFLAANAPEIPWKSVMGIRDHIAHGYFDIDADIIYDVVSNEIEGLHIALQRLSEIIDQ
jgi:uncharacterized protein with HEPN domain